MTHPDTCDLCGSSLDGTDGRTAAGLRLCSPCNAGTFHDRLADRGLRLECLGKHYYSHDGFVGSLGSNAEGAVPYELGLTGHFSTEDIFSKVGKWFSKELQVGDSGFDEAIYIKTDDPDALGEALTSEGLRAAIRYAVETVGEPVVLDGNKVTFEATDMLVEEFPPALRAVALILHHLEQIALQRGLPRRPELAVYPDLRETIDHLRTCATVGQKRYWPKGLVLTSATLDSLKAVGHAHDLMVNSGQPMIFLRIIDSHLISGDAGPLSTMSRLQELVLDGVPTVRVLPPLARLTELEDLRICRCAVTDLSPLAGLPSLTELWLRGTPVSDLRPLGGIRTLEKLDLRGTRVTDLSPLAQLPKLKMLWIQGLDAPAEQVHALRASLPALELDPY